MFRGFNRILRFSAALLNQLSIEDPYIASR